MRSTLEHTGLAQLLAPPLDHSLPASAPGHPGWTKPDAQAAVRRVKTVPRHAAAMSRAVQDDRDAVVTHPVQEKAALLSLRRRQARYLCVVCLSAPCFSPLHSRGKNRGMPQYDHMGRCCIRGALHASICFLVGSGKQERTAHKGVATRGVGHPSPYPSEHDFYIGGGKVACLLLPRSLHCD